MQTFLPYSNFEKSAKSLDYRRLGKQRVEGMQIIKAHENPNYGWQNHPATKMWVGFTEALKHYTNIMIREWISRGYNNNMKFYPVVERELVYPAWIGNEKFHLSHQSMLIQKNPEFYRPIFGNGVPDNLDYVWPV